MEKRGLSNFIVVVFLVLLVIAAIIIIWAFLQKYVQQQGEIADAKSDLLVGEIDIINYDSGNLTLERVAGVYQKDENRTMVLPPEVDVITVIDLSQSMNGTKIREAIQANIDFLNPILDVNNGSKIGVVGFGNIQNTNNPSFFHELSRDTGSLINKLNSFIANQRTCICCGINRSLQEFEQNSPNDKLKIMIVMSDGQPTGCDTGTEANNTWGTGHPDQCFTSVWCDGRNQSFKAAELAKQRFGEDLLIYSVGFGNNADQGTLGKIAEIGGGEYFYSNINNLLNIYTTIIQEVNTLYSSVQNYDYIVVVFYDNEGNTHTERLPFSELPKEVFQTKTFDFGYAENLLPGELIKIEIYAVITTPSGYVVEGSVMDIWEF